MSGKEKSVTTDAVNIAHSEGDSGPGFLHTSNDHDTLAPQNWSACKKRLLFLALMSSSILCDGGMTWGATVIVPQAIEWHIAIDRSAKSLNYGILLQGIGGVLFVPFINAFGRFPCWFWSQMVTLGVVLGCCFAQSFESFTALRALQGLFGTLPQVVGLPIIYDMYAPEDWPTMINIWGTTFLVGPALGPALAGYFMEGIKDWRAVFGVLAGLYGVSTILVVVFGQETFYDRAMAIQQTKKTKALLGIGNTRLPKMSTLVSSCRELITLAFLTPPLFLIGLCTLINFTWPIGIAVTFDTFIHAPPYLFGNIEGASMRFASVIGALLGFFFGLLFNNWIYNGSSGRRQAHWVPEYRLHGVWPSVAFMFFGLLTYGLTLANGKSWVGLAFGWCLTSLGLVASTVAITAFALEKYAAHATVVSAIINGWRTTGGFSVSYFQPPWIAKDGIAVVFGVQAAVVALGAVLFITSVMLMGRLEKQVKSTGCV